jgi:hypothetical protein
MSIATTCALGWVVVAGASVADAATRYRSGAVHAHLLDATSRLPNGAASPGSQVTGSDVMASFVALMAVLAFLFLVVTLVRRRTSLPA